MNWKSALFGTALALTGQNALAANKPLPCPTNSALVDKVGIIKDGTKAKIETRLKNIDSETHHQVVLITVENVQDYGYASIEEMANALGNTCKVGYRGESTGVIVLYTKLPSLYRIETAKTERYLTDAKVSNILGKSKDVCKKEDVSCRLDYVTSQIDEVIRAYIKNSQSVSDLKDSTKKFDQEEASKGVSNLLDALGIGAIVVSVTGGGLYGVNALAKRNRRRFIKKRILEVSLLFKTEREKYPQWFKESIIAQDEKELLKIENLGNNEIDDIVTNESKKVRFNEKISSIEKKINSWKKTLEETENKAKANKKEANIKLAEVKRIKSTLEEKGFTFKGINLPKEIGDGTNHYEIIQVSLITLSTLDEIQKMIQKSESIYNKSKGFDTTIKRNFEKKKTDLNQAAQSHRAIFGSSGVSDIGTLENQISKLITQFSQAYEDKDITSLEEISNQSNTIINSLDDKINTMNREIRFYQSIPGELSSRQIRLDRLDIPRNHKEKATEYVRKTGKSKFGNFNLEESLRKARGLLQTSGENYTQKKNINGIKALLGDFDNELGKISEYVGLGAALGVILAQELEEERRRAERRKRDEEAEEERKKRGRDDDNSWSRNTSSGRSSSSSDSWSSGGGSDYSGGGGTSD